jgi:hypothetical protein
MNLRERINASVADIRTRGQRLVQLNLELLAAEMKKKGQEYGAAIGMMIGAAVLALYAVGFVLATITALIALLLPWWAALLIVTALLFLVIFILIQLGRSRLKRVRTPAPERAIAEAQATRTAFQDGLTKVRSAVKPRRSDAEAPAASAPESASATTAPVPPSAPAAPPEPSGDPAPPAAGAAPSDDAAPSPDDARP